MLAALQKKAGLDEETVQDVRVYEAHSGKIYKELSDNFSIAGINEFVTLYAEKVPEEEANMQEGERTINAFSFDREPNKTHGVPFKFILKPVSATTSPIIISRFSRFAGRNLQGDKRTTIKTHGNQG